MSTCSIQTILGNLIVNVPIKIQVHHKHHAEFYSPGHLITLYEHLVYSPRVLSVVCCSTLTLSTTWRIPLNVAQIQEHLTIQHGITSRQICDRE